jgi:uncharacterized protein RhaS with RHS repeats
VWSEAGRSQATPLSGSYAYIYDKDRRLKQVNLPSGKQITNVYANGKLEEIRTPEGTIDLAYLCGTKVDSITQGTERIAYGYDGSLVTSEALSGTLNGSIAYGYNSDFNLARLTYAAGTVTLGYDNDGLLTSSGSFTIARNTGNGLPEAVTGGALSLTRTLIIRRHSVRACKKRDQPRWIRAGAVFLLRDDRVWVIRWPEPGGCA